MAAINQEFNLRFHDTALDNYVKKLEKSTVATDSQIGACDRLTKSSERMNQVVASPAIEQWLKSGQTWAQHFGAAENAAKKSADIEKSAIQMAHQRAAEETASAEKRMAAQFDASEAAIQARDKEEKAAQRLSEQLDAMAYKIEKLGVSSMGPEKLGVELDHLQKKLEKLGEGPGANSENLEVVEGLQEKIKKLGENTGKTEGKVKKAVSAFMNFGKASNPIDKLSNRLTRTVVTLFSVRKVLRYINDAMERAPDKIGSAFTALGSSVKDRFAGVMVSAMSGMQSGVEKLNAAMNSKSGQTLFRGLERAAELAGNAIGKLLEVGASLVEFLGDHATEVFTVAAIAAAFFAAQLIPVAVNSLIAAAPLLLIVGVIALIVLGLNKLGISCDEIISGIGAAFGWVYALIHNIVADLWNVIAAFVEFFANVWSDPLGSVARLFVDVFDTVLSVVETAAKAIDALPIFDTNFADKVSGFRSKMQSWVDEKFGEGEVKIERMEKIDYLDTANEWGGKAKDIASSFSLDSLGSMPAQELKAIKSDTSAIKKAVSLSTEDIKSLVDIAERRYVNQINLNSQTPIITVNGQNTGRTAEDRMALADAIKEILIEQTSSGSVVATAMP